MERHILTYFKVADYIKGSISSKRTWPKNSSLEKTEPRWLWGLIGAMFTQASLVSGQCAVRIPVPPYMIQSIYGGVLARIVRSGSICVYMTNKLFVRVCMYIDGGWL
jgi:hypothetical protein